MDLTLSPDDATVERLQTMLGLLQAAAERVGELEQERQSTRMWALEQLDALDARVTAAEQAIEALLARTEAAEQVNIRLQARLDLAEHRTREAEARAQRAEQKVRQPDGVKEWIADLDVAAGLTPTPLAKAV
jgi:chromosome segregation ATPase